MKYTLIMGGFALAFGIAAMANAEETAEHHATPGHQHRSEAYEQGKAKPTKPAEQVAMANTPDGKHLPGRDCKLNEGGTRQHTYAPYEIGNPNRPECPPESK